MKAKLGTTKAIEFAPLQFATTAKEALHGLLSRRGIGPYTVDGYSIADLIEKMIAMRHAEMERLKDDKIARLRAALEEIVTTRPPRPGPGIDWFQEWKNLAFRLKGIARKALSNEQE